MSENENKEQRKIEIPSLERIQQELGSATSIDDFFSKEGIFARLIATTLEHMLEAGYDWQHSRSWCQTGQAERQRKAGTVVVTDPDAEAKKS